MKPKRQLVPPLTWIVAGMVIIIFAGIMLIWLGQLGNGPNLRHKAIDSSNLRQIGQAALIYAVENEDRLPETNLGADGTPAEGETSTVHRYAVALAQTAGLNDLRILTVDHDQHRDVRSDWSDWAIIQRDLDSPSQEERGRHQITINPEFLESGVSYQLIGGLTMDRPSTTPIAFSRGLVEDGRWDGGNGLHGSKGGHIVYLGGDVRWHQDLSAARDRLASVSGEPTENILETISPEHAVYGDPDPPIPNGTRGSGTSGESAAE